MKGKIEVHNLNAYDLMDILKAEGYNVYLKELEPENKLNPLCYVYFDDLPKEEPE